MLPGGRFEREGYYNGLLQGLDFNNGIAEGDSPRYAGLINLSSQREMKGSKSNNDLIHVSVLSSQVEYLIVDEVDSKRSYPLTERIMLSL